MMFFTKIHYNQWNSALNYCAQLVQVYTFSGMEKISYLDCLIGCLFKSLSPFCKSLFRSIFLVCISALFVLVPVNKLLFYCYTLYMINFGYKINKIGGVHFFAVVTSSSWCCFAYETIYFSWVCIVGELVSKLKEILSEHLHIKHGLIGTLQHHKKISGSFGTTLQLMRILKLVWCKLDFEIQGPRWIT